MYLKLIFRTVDDLLEVRRVIMPAVKKNLPRIQMEQTYNDQSIEYEKSIKIRIQLHDI